MGYKAVHKNWDACLRYDECIFGRRLVTTFYVIIYIQLHTQLLTRNLAEFGES